ncbi:MAG: cell division protein ZapD [Gammaproteobacteria bacterium]
MAKPALALSSEPGPDRIVYEQPLSERVRAFLRLEYLFGRAEYLLEDTHPLASRGTLETVIDVMAVISRGDMRKELIKEFERQATTMEKLAGNPNVDDTKLRTVLEPVREMLATLRISDVVPGRSLLSDELISAVRQRSSIPAGTCDFDLPAYHFWLQSPPDSRLQDLREWLAEFAVLRDSVSLYLQLVRESASVSQEVAVGGFFQRTMEGNSQCQLIRVMLPHHASFYPEISGGRHRFTVRFMYPPSGGSRAAQTEEDVEFNLLCCMM